jgi:hypothetical protein
MSTTNVTLNQIDSFASTELGTRKITPSASSPCQAVHHFFYEDLLHLSHRRRYLRGIRDQSAAVEFRFRNGNSMWFPYSWMGTWQYNPSEGLLVKFSGDLVYLVLIRGSNLDRPLKEGAVTLTHAASKGIDCFGSAR